MLTDTTLAIISLALAVIGTLLRDPKRWVQAVIIALACVAAIFTIVKAAEDNKDKDFIKHALEVQLATSSQPKRFTYTLDAAVTRVGKQAGYEFDGEVITKEDDAIYWFKKDGQLNGALVLNATERGELFMKNTHGQPLDELLKPKMFSASSPAGQLQEDKDYQAAEIRDDLVVMVIEAMHDKFAWTSNLDLETSSGPELLSVRATDGERETQMKIEKRELDQLALLPPLQRNLVAYNEAGTESISSGQSTR